MEESAHSPNVSSTSPLFHSMYSSSPYSFFVRRHVYYHTLFRLSFWGEVTSLTFQFTEIRLLFCRGTQSGGAGSIFPLLALFLGQKNQTGSLSVSVSIPQFCPKNRNEAVRGLASEKSSLEEKARKWTLVDFICLKGVA